jgi:hypothetical protein
MKKIGIIKLLGVLFLTFGITDLNFENFNFDINIKAYAATFKFLTFIYWHILI